MSIAPPNPPHTAPPARDHELMQRTVDGDLEAFGGLVERHQGALVNYFGRCGVYTGEREDLAQETFVRIYRYRNRYRPTAQFTTFLYLVARQVRIDLLRRTERRRRLYDQFQQSAPQAAVPGAVERGERLDIEQALAALDETFREVVVLVLLQGLKHREAAEVLAIPIGTVKSRLNTALQRLRETVQGPKHDPESDE